jgi:hypothetical protein
MYILNAAIVVVCPAIVPVSSGVVHPGSAVARARSFVPTVL